MPLPRIIVSSQHAVRAWPALQSVPHHSGGWIRVCCHGNGGCSHGSCAMWDVSSCVLHPVCEPADRPTQWHLPEVRPHTLSVHTWSYAWWTHIQHIANLLTTTVSVCLCIRAHDSQANVWWQQAAVILQVEDSMHFLRCFYDNQYISTHCAPLADAYNDDITIDPGYHDQMWCITAQIKVSLRRLQSTSPNAFIYAFCS